MNITNHHSFKLIVILFLLAVIDDAGATPWKNTIEASLGVTQNQYSNNWQGGEASGFAWIANLNMTSQKLLTESLDSKNTLKLAFGQTHNQDETSKNWLTPLKSTDKIDFESLLRLMKGWPVDPFASLRIETQFIDNSLKIQTRNFDPMKISETVGASRTLLKTDKTEWNVRLGAGFRQYFNQDHVDAKHPDPCRLSTNDGGLQLDSDYKAPLNDRINATSKLTVFQAVYYSKADELKGTPAENYWKAMDVNWESTLTGHLTQFLTVNLNVQVLYDKEIALGGRFKETLSLGLTYIFNN